MPVLALAFFLVLPVAEAATNISGTISSDTTWTVVDSPVIITGTVTVASGVTLTIEPGVVVKMEGSSPFIINGTLRAIGSEAEPIYFTSSRDDEVGGDSNSNGSATLPAARDWRTIQFNAGSVGKLDNVVVRYGGWKNTSIKALPAIYNNGGSITIDNSEIALNGHSGIAQVGGQINLNGSSISDNEYGLIVQNGEADLTGNSFSNHTKMGLLAFGSGGLFLSDNTFLNNQAAANIGLQFPRTITHEGNSASGGSLNGLVLRGPVSGEVTLDGSDMPYLIDSGGTLDATGAITVTTENNLNVPTLNTLNLSPGVVIKFGPSAFVTINGTLNVNGTKDEPVFLTSYKDDEAYGDTNDDGSASSPSHSDWKQIKFNSGSIGAFDFAVIRYGGARVGTDLTQTGILNTGGNIMIENSQIHNNNLYGLTNTTGMATIHNSSLSGHGTFALWNKLTTPLDATNNYWGDSSGPYHSTLNPGGLGDKVSDSVLFDPWLYFYCTSECKPTILFLPGIKASRLYKDGLLGTEDQLWETLNSQDIAQLVMDNDGNSINDIYTKDVIDSAYGLEVYDDFLSFLVNLNDQDVINDFSIFPYDWRYDVFDIVESGTNRDFGKVYLVETIENLAISNGGPVTIIAHSNGGLLAKALIQQLEMDGKSYLIDRLILLASPQLGTPKTIASLLHGYDEGILTPNLKVPLINESTMRTVSVNLPGAYGLLPSKLLIDNLSEAVVKFGNQDANALYIDAYGNSIDNQEELYAFLTGQEGRPEAEEQKLEQPIKASSQLVAKSSEYHNGSLDNWLAPENIDIVEIVGTGLPTFKALYYQSFPYKECNPIDGCVTTLVSKPVPELDNWGDGTVLSKSATSYPGAKRLFYVDLEEADSTYDFSYRHHDIGNLPEIQELIRNTLENNFDLLPRFVSQTEPVFNEPYDLVSVHSPVSLSAIDEFGNRTELVTNSDYAEIKTDIPGSGYFELAEGKYLLIPSNINYQVELLGQDDGFYNLVIDKLVNGTAENVSRYELASTTPTMITRFKKSEDIFSNLEIDFDGDGEIDEIRTPGGELVNDNTEYSLSEVVDYIKSLGLKKKDETKLVVKLHLYYQSLNFKIGPPNKNNITNKLSDKLYKDFVKTLTKLKNTGAVSDSEYTVIISMVNKLKV